MGLREVLKDIEEKEGKKTEVTLDANEKDEPEKVEPVPAAKEPEAEPNKQAATDDDEADDAEPSKQEEAKDHQRERRLSKKELERQLKEKDEALLLSKAETAALRAVQQYKPEPKEEKPKRPDQNVDPDAARDWDAAEARNHSQKTQQDIAEIKQRLLVQDAVNELSGHVQRFAKQTPEAIEVMDKGFAGICHAVSLVNPGMDKSKVEEAAKMRILRLAGEAHQSGKDPAEAVYSYFRANGFSPDEKKTEAPVKSEAENLEAVRKNKARSAGPLTGGGQGGAPLLGKDAAKKMTVREFAKMKKEDINRVFAD